MRNAFPCRKLFWGTQNEPMHFTLPLHVKGNIVAIGKHRWREEGS